MSQCVSCCGTDWRNAALHEKKRRIVLCHWASLAGPAVTARGFLALGGIDHLAPPLLAHPFPLRSRGLKASPLKPNRGSGKRRQRFWCILRTQTLLMKSKMCTVLCTWFVLPCPSLVSAELTEFCIFCFAKNYRTPLTAPLLAPGAYTLPCTLPDATAACTPAYTEEKSSLSVKCRKMQKRVGAVSCDMSINITNRQWNDIVQY